MPAGPHLEQHDRGEAECGGRLDQGGECDEYGAQDRPPAERRDQAGTEQAEHDGVVVRARDQVQQHERVQRAQPQRGGRVGAAVPGEARQCGRHQCHPEERYQAHAEETGGQFAARHGGQGGGDAEEHRAVRRPGVSPQRGDLVRERAPQMGRPVRVHVDVRVDHGALGQIAVHVPAEQRRRDHQRGGPDGEHQQQGAWGRRVGAAHEAPQQQPRHYQQDDTEVHADQAQGGVHRAGGQQFPDRQSTGRLTAQGEEGGAGQTEDLAAAEIEGKSHGQHSVSVSTRSGLEATRSPPGGSRSVSGR